MGAALMFGVVGWRGRDTGVEVPGIDGTVALPLLTMMSTIVTLLGPLYRVFPTVEETLARERIVRLARGLLAVLLTIASFAPSSGGAASRGEWPRLLTLAWLGVAAIILIGDLAWTVVLAIGTVFVLVDNAFQSDPVTDVFERVGVVAPGVALVLAVGVYARTGAGRAPSAD